MFIQTFITRCSGCPKCYGPIPNSDTKVEEFSPDEIYEIYKSLFQINKEFAISIEKLNYISNYFDKEEEKESNELDLFTVKGKKEKILKNYFILISILAQILSLMMLLFLFRNIIKDKIDN